MESGSHSGSGGLSGYRGSGDAGVALQMNKRKCNCEFCTVWSPAIKRVRAKLDGEERDLFDRIIDQWFDDSDDLNYAMCKLKGDWEGWEWMKEAVKQHGVVA